MHKDKFNSPIQPSVGDYGLFDVLNTPKEAKVGICALTRKRKPPSCVGRASSSSNDSSPPNHHHLYSQPRVIIDLERQSL
jgi:hypothetical protein